MVSFLFLIIGFALAAFVSERSLKQLTETEVGLLMKETALFRKFNLVAIFIFVGLSYLVEGYVGSVLFLLCLLSIQSFSIRKVLSLNLPLSCKKAQIASVVIVNLGILLTLCAIWLRVA